MNRIFAAIALITLLVQPATAMAAPASPIWRDAAPWSTERAYITIGDLTVEAEIADTPSLQRRGLSYRDALLPGTAMLFQFDGSSVRSFWMRGMRFCLDIVWIENNRVVGAAENVCPLPGVVEADLPRYSSEVPVTFVLEVPGGWMQEHDLAAGDPVDIELPESVDD